METIPLDVYLREVLRDLSYEEIVNPTLNAICKSDFL
jgi:hypothetical protein